MKVLLLATVFTFTTQAAFADCKLPEVLKRNLQDASAKTATRIVGLQAWDRLSDDHAYRDAVQTEDQKLSVKVGLGAMLVGAPHSAAGTGAFLTSSTSGHPYDEGALATGRWWANLVDKMGGFNAAMAGVALSTAGSYSMMSGLDYKKNPVDRNYVLNNDGVDKFVGEAAGRLKVMFGLSKEKEASLRTQLREAIAEDAKQPVDKRRGVNVYIVAEEAKYAGKDLFSKQDKAILEEIRNTLAFKDTGPVYYSPDENDRIRALLVGTAMIEEFKERPDAARDGIVKANRNLLEEISAFKKANCGVAHSDDDISDDAKSGDAN